MRDVERGLSLGLRVLAYTNDAETKAFLEREAQKLAPGTKRRSGVRYRLNRWREEQLVNGAKLTYRDLVREYVRLNQTSEPFARIPHVRYVNFLSDFLSAETGATREQVEQFGKAGFIDRTGEWVIPPRFEDAGLFSAEGLALVQVKQRAGLAWGFADRTGNLVLPVQYEGAKAFSQGFAPAELAGKWGFIDSKGQWAVSPQFDGLEPLERGWARAMQGDRIGYVNAKGERLHWAQ